MLKLKSSFTCLLLLLFSIFVHAQQLPEWVHELKKVPPDYYLLKSLYEDFWKNKIEEGQTIFEEEIELKNESDYGYLRSYIREYREIMALHLDQRKKGSSHTISKNRVSAGGNWQALGPLNTPTDTPNVWSGVPFGVGRVNQVAFSGSHPNVMYAVAPAGVFISIDTANTWQATGTDRNGYLSYFCLAIDPLNDSIMYVGCGDYSFNPADFNQAGILKSIDFGQSFTPLAIDSTPVFTIKIDPQNSSHVLAGGYGGIWQTTDAGQNWQHTLTMNDPSITGHWIYDIEFNPTNGNTCYATSDSSYFISSDGGLTWNLGFNDFQFTETFSRELLVEVCPSAPNIVYICSMQDFGNIYKSFDSGQNFIALKRNSEPGLTGYTATLGAYGQGFYDFCFSVDPFNANHLSIGSISMYESFDGGISWNTFQSYWGGFASAYKLHPDQHFIGKNPGLPDRIFVANDGGVYVRMNGDSVFQPKQQQLNVTQISHFAASTFVDSLLAFGTQDNGGMYLRNGNYSGFRGGDLYSKIYCSYSNDIAIITENATSLNLNSPPGLSPFPLPETDYYEPMTFVPLNPQISFIGNQHLFRCTDLMNAQSSNWQQVFFNNGNEYFKGINHSLADSNFVFAARTDRYLFRSFDALSSVPTWDSVPLPPIPINNIWNMQLVTIPGNRDELYLCADSVYHSADRGVTWSNITAGLPLIYDLRCLIADPYALDGSIYIASTNKIFYRNNNSNWIDYSNGLPETAFITDLSLRKFSNQSYKLFVSTFGRGMWQSDVYQSTVSTNELKIISAQLLLFPNPANTQCTFKSDEACIQSVYFYNSGGQLICFTESTFAKNSMEFDLSGFGPGIYFADVKTDSGTITKKIIIER